MWVIFDINNRWWYSRNQLWCYIRNGSHLRWRDWVFFAQRWWALPQALRRLRRRYMHTSVPSDLLYPRRNASSFMIKVEWRTLGKKKSINSRSIQAYPRAGLLSFLVSNLIRPFRSQLTNRFMKDVNHVVLAHNVFLPSWLCSHGSLSSYGWPVGFIPTVLCERISRFCWISLMSRQGINVIPKDKQEGSSSSSRPSYVSRLLAFILNLTHVT